jgi:uncharacterized protein YdeI (YjbR/CyaY-like superfamily)
MTPSAGGKPELPVITPRSRAEWMRWLEKNGEKHDGVWVRHAKKGTGVPSLSWDEAVEVALCHGWIDGTRVGEDETFYRQRFTPRRKGSRWSKINVDRVEALIAAGEMTRAGQREIDAAKADGRWEAAYAGPATAVAPDDLRAALDADPVAAAFYAQLSSANRFAIIHRVNDAKRPATRAARIEKFVAMCRAGETLH